MESLRGSTKATLGPTTTLLSSHVRCVQSAVDALADGLWTAAVDASVVDGIRTAAVVALELDGFVASYRSTIAIAVANASDATKLTAAWHVGSSSRPSYCSRLTAATAMI